MTLHTVRMIIPTSMIYDEVSITEIFLLEGLESHMRML